MLPFQRVMPILNSPFKQTNHNAVTGTRLCIFFHRNKQSNQNWNCFLLPLSQPKKCTNTLICYSLYTVEVPDLCLKGGAQSDTDIMTEILEQAWLHNRVNLVIATHHLNQKATALNCVACLLLVLSLSQVIVLLFLAWLVLILLVRAWTLHSTGYIKIVLQAGRPHVSDRTLICHWCKGPSNI